MNLIRTWLLIALTLLFSEMSLAASGQVDSFTFKSEVLAENRIDLNLNRTIKVWLPPSYQDSDTQYPVIYYLHSVGWSNHQMFDVEKVHHALERAVSRKQIDEFIFVAGDFTTPVFGTFFGNNAVAGHWLDHVIDELVPEIDKRYRTLAKPQSRGLTGDMMGGYAALRIAMERPGTFGAVYALHPVGTDIGETLMRSRPDWRLMNTARTWDELDANIFSKVFMVMAQSHAPNLTKPPFYADLMMDLVGDELVVNAENSSQLQENFLLSERVPDSVENLKQLRGLGFDWGRFDENPDHVYANQKFTRKLAEYGIKHIAEEYNGNSWNRKWGEYGRAETDMLPFFQRHLDFD